MTPRIVALPYRGLRCRNRECQTELVMVRTTRGKTMPLERNLVELNDDIRGLFVAVTGSIAASPDEDLKTPVAVGIRTARELGFNVPAGELVYRAHWAGCSGRKDFRR